jgi:chromosome segregation ATPase
MSSLQRTYGTLFDTLDSRKTGYLTPRSIILSLRTHPELGAQLGLTDSFVREGSSRDKLLEVFRNMDKDRDERVSRSEFVEFEIALQAQSDLDIQNAVSSIHSTAAILNNTTEAVDANDTSIEEGHAIVQALKSPNASASSKSSWDGDTSSTHSSRHDNISNLQMILSPRDIVVAATDDGATATATATATASAAKKSASKKQATLGSFKTFDKHTSRFNKLAALRLADEGDDATFAGGVVSNNPNTPVKVLLEPSDLNQQPSDSNVAESGGRRERSISQNLADSSSFIINDAEDDAGDYDYGGGNNNDSNNNTNTSTSSLTHALLQAHRKNKFLEDELKKEKVERVRIAESIRVLQGEVEEAKGGSAKKKSAITENNDAGNHNDDETTVKTRPGAATDEVKTAIQDLERRALQAERTAELLQKQLSSATSNFSLQSSLAMKERELLLKDIDVLGRSKSVVESIGGGYGEGAIGQQRHASELTAVLNTTTASKRDAISAQIALTLHSTLLKAGCLNNNVGNDVTAKACVDAALVCVERISELAVEFNTSEESITAARERLERMNARLDEEGKVLKGVMDEIRNYHDIKNGLEESIEKAEIELNSVQNQVASTDNLVRKIQDSVRTEEEKGKESAAQIARETQLLAKKCEMEKERLTVLKGQVDTEQEHLHSLRMVAESEFDALQRNVEDLAKKAVEVKDDIGSKQLVCERLKDKVKVLDKMKVEKERDFDKQQARHDKDLTRLRGEVSHQEDLIRELRDEVAKKRAREEESIEVAKFEVAKYERMALEMREDQTEEKKTWEDKRKRWSAEVDAIRKECSERERTLEEVNGALAEGNDKVEVARRELRELRALTENIAEKKAELAKVESYKIEIEESLAGSLSQMELTITKGKEISTKLANDEDELAVMEQACGRKKRELERIEGDLKRVQVNSDRVGGELELAEGELKRVARARLEEDERKRKLLVDIEKAKEERDGLTRSIESSRNDMVNWESSKKALAESVELLKAQESSCMLSKDAVWRDVESAKGEKMRLDAEIKGLEKTRESCVGLEKGLQSNLAFLREEVAKIVEEKKSLSMRTEEAGGLLEKRELELREMERLVGVAQTKKIEIDRVRVKWENDVKEMRMLERELSALRSSRDLAASEAARCEEEAVYAREELRELEGKMYRARGHQVGGDREVGGSSGAGEEKKVGEREFVVSPGQRVEIVGGKVDLAGILGSDGGGGRAGGGGGVGNNSLLMLKERIDGLTTGKR